MILRILLVAAGIFAGQALLYGPSLLGKKILLPLDILEQPKNYIPVPPNTAVPWPHNNTMSDLVFNGEPERLAAAREIKAGRLPQWNPREFAGAPSLFPKLSPFAWLLASIESPRIIPWVQLLTALVAGIGAYLFFRQALQIGFWPAAIISWCYPLSGFFLLWQGGGLTQLAYGVVWLPWMLLAVDRTIRGASLFGGLQIALVTGLVLVSGRPDVAGHVLLSSGLYAIGCYCAKFAPALASRSAMRALLSVVAGWSLGFLLAAPSLLPLIEYIHTGARYEDRSKGSEERPPIGLAALPEVFLPKIYGSTASGSVRMTPGVLPEGSSQAYAGVLAGLLFAPLAWTSRRHRPVLGCLLFLGFFALSWTLNVPGFVSLLRLPVLKVMSHNRFVFVTAFALMAMAAVGLDQLWTNSAGWRSWFWLPISLLGAALVWAIYRLIYPPELIASYLNIYFRNTGQPFFSPPHVIQIQSWFAIQYAGIALLSAVALIAWLSLRSRNPWKPLHLLALGAVLMGDLLWFGSGEISQCDPQLYFPKIPLLQALAKAPPGRILGAGCLPANLAETQGLSDIRGYDAIDPARLMELMSLAASPEYSKDRCSQTQWFVPLIRLPDAAPPFRPMGLCPILDMLNVRYVVFRGLPPAGVHPDFQSPDYWALENKRALPRAYVPERVETVADSKERLGKLGSPGFDPRKIAYVETPVGLPDRCAGSATILDEIPTRITLLAKMQTAGMVVLADLWDTGWHATIKGKSIPILRTNQALRGVLVEPGDSQIVLSYQPASFTWGLRMAGFGLGILLLWGLYAERQRRAQL